MNPDNENHQDRDDARLIDRLVDGELPDSERRELLQSFENQPDGWRRCALAFLEAQVWRQALSLEAAPAAVSLAARPIGRHPRSRLWRPVARITALAASLAAAFALGWTYHRGLEQTQPVIAVTQPDAATNGSVLVADAPSSIRQPVTSDDPKTQFTKSLSSMQATHGSLDSMMKRWQQEGYSVETQPCLVSVQAKDGRKINLPVQEVRVRYVGDRVY
jgi:hypothetical protein